MITSENELVHFRSFALTVFWDSASYTVIFLFWTMLIQTVNVPARWWPWMCLKSDSGLRRLEKTGTFWDAYMSLTWCSIIVLTNGGNWLHLLFYFIVLLGIFSSVLGMSSLICVSGFRLKFFVFQCHGNVCNWIPKVIWSRMGWFRNFSLEYSFFWIHICMDWNLHELLKLAPFWRHRIFSIVSSRGILVCSLKLLVIFSRRNL